MSLGIGVFAYRDLEDEDMVLYNYGVYDLNDPELRNSEHITDGSIIILKECFVEPEIHSKIKRINARKKRVSVRVPRYVDIVDLIRNESIIIENSRSCWKMLYEDDHTDIMAFRLVSLMFNKYQTDSVIPDHVRLDMRYILYSSDNGTIEKYAQK